MCPVTGISQRVKGFKDILSYLRISGLVCVGSQCGSAVVQLEKHQTCIAFVFSVPCNFSLIDSHQFVVVMEITKLPLYCFSEHISTLYTKRLEKPMTFTIKGRKRSGFSTFDLYFLRYKLRILRSTLFSQHYESYEMNRASWLLRPWNNFFFRSFVFVFAGSLEANHS